MDQLLDETVLLTGATGALGTRVTRDLKRNDQVARLLMLSRRANDGIDESGRARTIYGDLCNPDFAQLPASAEIKDVTTVIHMAADVRWNQELATSIAVNAEATKNLILFLKKNAPRLRRFVHVSTAYVDA